MRRGMWQKFCCCCWGFYEKIFFLSFCSMKGPKLSRTPKLDNL